MCQFIVFLFILSFANFVVVHLSMRYIILLVSHDTVLHVNVNVKCPCLVFNLVSSYKSLIQLNHKYFQIN